MNSRYVSFDEYGFRHLPNHLIHAGRDQKLREILFEFDWLEAKLEATDITALVGDYELLLNDRESHLVQSALWLSEYVLAQDKKQLAGQLLGRLLSFETPSIKALLVQAKQWRGVHAWLRPMMACLTPPGGPLIRTLKIDTDRVTAVALTPDGQRAVTISDSGGLTLVPMTGELKIWDMMMGRVTYTLASQVTAIATASNGQVVSASRDGSLMLWDIVNGGKLHTFTGHTDAVEAVAVTPDGRLVVSASTDKTLKVWDLVSGAELHTLSGHTDTVTVVAVTPDGRLAVSASTDKTLKVWDLISGTELRTFKDLITVARAIAVTPDGRRVVLASVDEPLKVWDLVSGTELCTLGSHKGGNVDIIITRNGQQVVSGSENTIKVWDLESVSELRAFTGHTSTVNAIAMTLDERFVISASVDEILLWDMTSEVVEHPLPGHTDAVNMVLVSPDGRLAVSASADKILKVWDIINGFELGSRALIGHTDVVTAVTVTPDGRLAVSASADKTLKVWSLIYGVELHALTGHTDVVTAVAVTPDGRLAVSASKDNDLKVWDLESGAELRTLSGHTEGVKAVGITPDGRRVASVSVDSFGISELKVWNVANGRKAKLPYNKCSGWTAAITPDGCRAVLPDFDHGHNPLIVWNLSSKPKACILDGRHHNANMLALTTDGRWAVSVSRIKLEEDSWDYSPKNQPDEIKVWDIINEAELSTLEGHRSHVTAIAITPDGQNVASAWTDLTLQAWKPAEEYYEQEPPDTFRQSTAVQVRASFTFSMPVTTCAISPDGRKIVAGDCLGCVSILEWMDGIKIPISKTASKYDETNLDWTSSDTLPTIDDIPF